MFYTKLIKMKIYKNNDDNSIFVTNIEFEDTPLGECKTRFGETFFSCYTDKIDPEQIVKAYTYWNGSNMESIVLDNGEIPWFLETKVENIEGTEAEEILKSCPDPSPNEYKEGVAEITKDKYKYIFTQYPHWAMCKVE